MNATMPLDVMSSMVAFLRGADDPDGSAAVEVMNITFAAIEVAEEEIAAAKVAYPDHADAIDNVFAVAYSPAIPVRAPIGLHRTHVRQLCRAVAQGSDLDVPTLVEWACIVGMGSIELAVAPSTNMCVPFMRDAETMAAFGQEAQPYPDHLGAELVEGMKAAYRHAYAAQHWTHKPRAEAYRQCRREREAQIARQSQPSLL